MSEGYTGGDFLRALYDAAGCGNPQLQDYCREIEDKKIMGLKLVYEYKRRSYEDSYGGVEYFQDDDTDVYRIYQLDGGQRHFKQNGRQSSYGDATWEDDLTEVEPKTKSVVTYEYEDM